MSGVAVVKHASRLEVAAAARLGIVTLDFQNGR